VVILGSDRNFTNSAMLQRAATLQAIPLFAVMEKQTGNNCFSDYLDRNFPPKVASLTSLLPFNGKKANITSA